MDLVQIIYQVTHSGDHTVGFRIFEVHWNYTYCDGIKILTPWIFQAWEKILMDWQCLLHNLTGYFVKISEPYFFVYFSLHVLHFTVKNKTKETISQPFLNLWLPLRIYLNYIERIFLSSKSSEQIEWKRIKQKRETSTKCWKIESTWKVHGTE